MTEDNVVRTEIDKRISTLTERGYDEELGKMVRNSALIQTGFLPLDSVLAWLDERIANVKDRTGKADKHV